MSLATDCGCDCHPIAKSLQNEKKTFLTQIRRQTSTRTTWLEVVSAIYGHLLHQKAAYALSAFESPYYSLFGEPHVIAQRIHFEAESIPLLADLIKKRM